MNEEIVAQLSDIVSLLEKMDFPEAAAYVSMALELLSVQSACMGKTTIISTILNEWNTTH